MSEQGWIDFLHAEGVDDWVVLHGGATAVFRARSLGEAADLAAAIARVPDLEAVGALLTIAADHLTVRLTRGVFQLEPTHEKLARAVSAVARSRGVAVDRGAAQEVQLAIAAKPEDVDVGFWRAVSATTRGRTTTRSTHSATHRRSGCSPRSFEAAPARDARGRVRRP